MFVIASCAMLFAVAVGVAARWSALDLQPPTLARGDQDFSGASPRQGSTVVTRPLWYGYLVLGAGVIAGVLGAGAGGRLIMRMLALTSPPSADGRITEAQEVVGEISVSGTLALFTFGGAITGVLAAALYVVLYRWLPSGRARGVAFGALILVAFGWWVEPLRGSNPDFDIVGPGWLTVLSFSVLALVEGMLVAAVVGRLSRAFRMQVTTPPTKAWNRPERWSSAGSPLLLQRLPPCPASSSRSLTSSAAAPERQRRRGGHETNRGTAGERPMLCPCKSRARRGLAARMFVVRSERVQAGPGAHCARPGPDTPKTLQEHYVALSG